MNDEIVNVRNSAALPNIGEKSAPNKQQRCVLPGFKFHNTQRFQLLVFNDACIDQLLNLCHTNGVRDE